jgi:HEAT repeat protein
MLNTIVNVLAVQRYLVALNSEEEAARRQAAIQLGKLRSKRATKPLLALLCSEPDDVTRRWIQEALIQSADWRIVPPLIAELKDNKAGIIRYHATTIIGALVDQLYQQPLIYEEALHALLSVLKNPKNPRGLRAYAAAALVAFRDTRAIEPLITVLETAPTKPAFSIEVVKALGELGSRLADYRAISPLIAQLKIPLNELKEFELCRTAALALAKFRLNFAFMPAVAKVDVLVYFLFAGNEKQRDYAYQQLGGGILYAFNPAALNEVRQNLGEEGFQRAQRLLQLYHNHLSSSFDN